MCAQSPSPPFRAGSNERKRTALRACPCEMCLPAAGKNRSSNSLRRLPALPLPIWGGHRDKKTRDGPIKTPQNPARCPALIGLPYVK